MKRSPMKAQKPLTWLLLLLLLVLTPQLLMAQGLRLSKDFWLDRPETRTDTGLAVTQSLMHYMGLELPSHKQLAADLKQGQEGIYLKQIAAYLNQKKQHDFSQRLDLDARSFQAQIKESLEKADLPVIVGVRLQGKGHDGKKQYLLVTGISADQQRMRVADPVAYLQKKSPFYELPVARLHAAYRDARVGLLAVRPAQELRIRALQERYTLSELMTNKRHRPFAVPAIKRYGSYNLAYLIENPSGKAQHGLLGEHRLERYQPVRQRWERLRPKQGIPLAFTTDPDSTARIPAHAKEKHFLSLADFSITPGRYRLVLSTWQVGERMEEARLIRSPVFEVIQD